MKHADLRPKKSLSQNFLVDERVSARIASSLGAFEGETVVEIGPGTGALTRQLLPLCSKLVCVELDDRAVIKLREDFHAALETSMELLHQDFLQLSLHDMAQQLGKKIAVIGNIPYAISSPILFHVFDQAVDVRCAVMMMQKEVAQRLVAAVGTKEYGVLTLAAKCAGSAKILFDVKPGSFFPRPSVTSSVVRMDFNPLIPDAVELSELRALVRAAFGQRRKTLRNAVEQHARMRYHCEIRQQSFSWLDKRAEQLSLQDFRAMKADLEGAAS